jgi:hypothetical protein
MLWLTKNMAAIRAINHAQDVVSFELAGDGDQPFGVRR